MSNEPVTKSDLAKMVADIDDAMSDLVTQTNFLLNQVANHNKALAQLCKDVGRVRSRSRRSLTAYFLGQALAGGKPISPVAAEELAQRVMAIPE